MQTCAADLEPVPRVNFTTIHMFHLYNQDKRFGVVQSFYSVERHKPTKTWLRSAATELSLFDRAAVLSSCESPSHTASRLHGQSQTFQHLEVIFTENILADLSGLEQRHLKNRNFIRKSSAVNMIIQVDPFTGRNLKSVLSVIIH